MSSTAHLLMQVEHYPSRGPRRGPITPAPRGRWPRPATPGRDRHLSAGHPNAPHLLLSQRQAVNSAFGRRASTDANSGASNNAEPHRLVTPHPVPWSEPPPMGWGPPGHHHPSSQLFEQQPPSTTPASTQHPAPWRELQPMGWGPSGHHHSAHQLLEHQPLSPTLSSTPCSAPNNVILASSSNTGHTYPLPYPHIYHPSQPRPQSLFPLPDPQPPVLNHPAQQLPHDANRMAHSLLQTLSQTMAASLAQLLSHHAAQPPSTLPSLPPRRSRSPQHDQSPRKYPRQS